MHITIVSGASQNHFKSLCQFLRSIPSDNDLVSNVIIYDLGLASESRQQLATAFPDYDLRIFDFSRYPDYFNIEVEAGQYAWKPVIVHEVMHRDTPDILLWCDAGTIIHGTLDSLRDVVLSQGVYTPISAGCIYERTHSKTLRWFGVHNNFLFVSKQCRAGGLVAFHTASEPVRKMVEKWAEYAQIEECIAPLGSNRTNHRQDQSILSILYYLHFKDTKTVGGYLTFSVQNDID